MRQAPVLRQKDVQMGVAIDSLRPPSAGLQRNQWCTFSFLPQQWCCTIKVDTGNSKSQYIEKEKQEARRDGSESRVDRLEELEPYDAGNMALSLGGDLGSCFIQPDRKYMENDMQSIMNAELDLRAIQTIF